MGAKKKLQQILITKVSAVHCADFHVRALGTRLHLSVSSPDLEIECIHTSTGYALFVFGVHTGYTL